jgi:hypothetical protein
VKEISETDKSVTPIRRSERIENRPQPCYNDELTEMQTYLNCMITFHNTTIPKSYTEIKEREDRKQWEDAINEEIQALEVNQTWTLIDKSIGKNIIGCRWVFTIKNDAMGNPIKYKARLVAKGFSQQYSIDYNETVARITTFRFLLAWMLKLHF